MVTNTKTKERQVEIPSGRRRLSGILRVPSSAAGVVAFAHGSGSGRFSPRNQFVARALEEGGLATLLLDLLEEEEAGDRAKVFDIELLAERLQSAADWLRREPETSALRLGYFGASTGAGAALVAAARNPSAVGAVVSRGGRPDLARTYLSAVQAPTLLIVGGNDEPVIELNEQALRLLRCPKELVIIPGATHLFEEPGTLEEVARLAKQWFVRNLTPVAEPSSPGHR
jgi:putative phosphoribosyl transferase